MSNNNIPIGTIVMWGGKNNCPDDWLVCNGNSYKKEDFPLLAAILENNFGDGKDSSFFTIPDLRGMFVRGVDDHDEKGLVDIDRASRKSPSGTLSTSVGSIQGPGMPGGGSHLSIELVSANSASGGFKPEDTYVECAHRLGTDAAVGFFLESVAGSSNEVRPANVYLHFLIRAK